MAVQEDYSPRVDININAIGAVLRQHLMLIILNTKHVLLSLAQLGQAVENCGFARVLKSKDSDDEEVCVVSQVISDAIAETMILVHQLESLPQLGQNSLVTNRVSSQTRFGCSRGFRPL